ncbi:MAG: hypothetical protein VX733_12635 [Candidatus Latescibacterota bacterium]|nr:hypothetical protein [Candidatus Latescibacterota bacterium]
MATLKSSARQTLANAAGIGGLILIAVALFGVHATPPGLFATPAPAELVAAEAMAPGNTIEEMAGTQPSPEVPITLAEEHRAEPPLHYPLEVGRYWVYRYEEPGSDVIKEVERVIVRRQARMSGKQLFFFGDGDLAYFEDGKVFEMGKDGGVNIIPLDVQETTEPVVYRSQGLRIKKWLGAVDTSLVVGEHIYEGCLEVVSRFHSVMGRSQSAVSYSSFYAPGVGLIGREKWPRAQGASGLSVALRDHGTRNL